MPVGITVHVVVSETLARVLQTNIDGIAEPVIRAIANDSALPKLGVYPDPSRKKQPFKSAKSRRYFFAALRRGQITVPYQRSGSLARNWKLTSVAGGVGKIVNSRPYDKFVMGEAEEQARYFAGTWTTVTGVAEYVETQDAARIAERVIDRVLNGGN